MWNWGVNTTRRYTREHVNEDGTRDISKDENYNRGTVSVTNLIQQLMGNVNQETARQIQTESLSQASQDVGGVVDQIFNNYREQALPQIFQSAQGAGVYGNSTTQLLTNDAYSRAVGQASEATMATANTYATQRINRQAQLEQLITNLFGIDLEQTGSTSTDQNETWDFHRRTSGRKLGLDGNVGQGGAGGGGGGGGGGGLIG